MQAVERPIHMDIESPSHVPGPINGNPYATVNQAMKMKCRVAEEEDNRDSDYPGEKKVAKYNGDSLVFQFPLVPSEKQMQEENRKEAMNELLENLGVDPSMVTAVSTNDQEITMTITSSKLKSSATRNPKPPQRESSFKATRRLSAKATKTTSQSAKPSPIDNFEVPMVQTAPDGNQNVYYASHYAASQPGKVKAKLHIDPHSTGHVSPTASPELISNRKLLLDVIEGGEESEDDFTTGSMTDSEVQLQSEQVKDPLRQDSDSQSEEEISYHESPTLPKRGNVAEKVQYLSKSIAFSPPQEPNETSKRKNTSVPLIGLTHLAPTEVSDRIARHNEKSLAAGQVMSTANMVLYSSKQPPKKVIEHNSEQNENENKEVEDFRTAMVLHHRQDGWNKVETNESDTSDVQVDLVDEEYFPPPPPPTPPVVKTINLGDEAEFRINIQVSDIGKHVPSPTNSEGHIDSGYEDSATSVAQVTEPAIQKLSVHVEESVSEDLLNEIFHNGSESLPVALPQKAQGHPSSDKVTVVLGRPDSEERRFAEEDEACGYSRIEDITPGKGQEDTNKKNVTENGMTDEEFLNSYKIIQKKEEVPKMVEPVKKDVQHTEPKSPPIVKLSAAERGPAVLNELINGIRTMKQEMSYKAREHPENVESDVFPKSPISDKSSPTTPLSPTSTLSSRGKRRRRKTSDKGYSSTNSSLSESD